MNLIHLRTSRKVLILMYPLKVLESLVFLIIKILSEARLEWNCILLQEDPQAKHCFGADNSRLSSKRKELTGVCQSFPFSKNIELLMQS